MDTYLDDDGFNSTYIHPPTNIQKYLLAHVLSDASLLTVVVFVSISLFILALAETHILTCIATHAVIYRGIVSYSFTKGRHTPSGHEITRLSGPKSDT